MTLPSSPNIATLPLLTRGDQGWPVYGLQTGLDYVGFDLTFDGVFGSDTYNAVQKFQRGNYLTDDGVAGVLTQARLISLLDTRTHNRHDKLPVGLLRGIAETESGNNLSAVNWKIPGGVDCGVVQVRCFGKPYDMSELRSAYNPAVSLERAAVTFQGRVISFRSLPYAKKHSLEFAQRCAALAWNWPYAAEQYAMRGGLPNPNKEAEWAAGIKFLDGTAVKTWKDWCEFYALGGKHGEGKVTRYVQWTKEK